jgi:hypothetical protein
MALAIATCALGGCLPVGNPPPGHHVLADRTLSAVYLSPSESDGVPSHLLVTGPPRALPSYLDARYADSVGVVFDLYELLDASEASQATSLAGRQPIVADLAIPSLFPTTYIIPSDSLGRLLVLQAGDPTSPDVELDRVDLADATKSILGPTRPVSRDNPGFALSPLRTRLFVGSAACPDCEDLCDHDGCVATGADPENGATFIGEDFYYSSLGPNWGIYRIKPSPASTPERLVAASTSIAFVPIHSDGPPRLLLSLVTASGHAPFAVFDTETLVSTPLPAEKGNAQYVAASFDGHWLLFESTQPSASTTGPGEDHTLFLFDWTTGAHQTLNSDSVGRPIGALAEWRPGHAELWFSTWPDGSMIWRPNDSLTVGGSSPFYWYEDQGSQSASLFTPDGRYWFSRALGDHALMAFVGSADDPSGPVFPLNPRGTSTAGYRQTSDGQLLVEAHLLSADRGDLYLVNPDTGASRPVGNNGHVLALGQTRALALLDWQLSTSTGTLTLIDLVTGGHTVLAENVYALAVDRGQSAQPRPGNDDLAAGIQVAVLKRNRIASPYDGLWVVTLP